MKKNNNQYEKFNCNKTIQEITIQHISGNLLSNIRDAQGHRFDTTDTIYIYMDIENLDIENYNQKTICFGSDAHISNYYMLICSFRYLSLFDESEIIEIAKKIVSSLEDLKQKAKALQENAKS